MNILEKFKQSIDFEANQLSQTLVDFNQNIEEIIKVLLDCQGKVVITGVGKSAHIGRKISATLSSTGTPSCFMHATEGIHGDLGLIESKDIVILISNSGETQEVMNLLPSLNKISCKKIAITSNEKSTLAQMSDYEIHYHYECESDHLKLAPTVSALIVLAIGDALATTLSELKSFTKSSFHLYHPGGSLGKKLESDK